MLKPARAKSWIVVSCSDPFGSPSFSRVVASATSYSSSRARLERLETRSGARVAHVAVPEPPDPQQHGVLVAVHEHLDDLQPVAGGFPFRPQRLPGAAEERREACRHRAIERLTVHEA